MDCSICILLQWPSRRIPQLGLSEEEEKEYKISKMYTQFISNIIFFKLKVSINYYRFATSKNGKFSDSSFGDDL